MWFFQVSQNVFLVLIVGIILAAGIGMYDNGYQLSTWVNGKQVYQNTNL